jgi:hypothetical protein
MSGVILATALCSACASSVTLSTVPVAKQTPVLPAGSPRARLAEFTGAPCFREEVQRYLSSPGGLQLASQPGPDELTLAGRTTRIEVHSNRGDKEAAMLYFSAFVITAPIAAAMYGAKDWHADAAADGDLTASDPTGVTIWSRGVTVSVAESQRSMPSREALEVAMTAAVCQKLAATLLNALTDYLMMPR